MHVLRLLEVAQRQSVKLRGKATRQQINEAKEQCEHTNTKLGAESSNIDIFEGN